MQSPLLSMITRGERARFLTRDEPLDAFRRWRDEGDQAAHELLVQSIAPLVLRMACQFARKVGQRSDVEEYESYALEGLLRAIDKFDASFGARLATYAGHWVYQALQRGYEKDRVVAVPGDLVRGGGRAHLPEKRTRPAEIALRPMAPISATGAFDEGDRASDVLLVAAGASPHDEAAEREEREHVRRRVHAALDRLQPRTRYVLTQRIFAEKTLVQIGNEIGVTRERVRQIEHKGKARMKELLKQQGHEVLTPIGNVGTRDEPLSISAGAADPLSLVEALQRLPLDDLDAALRELEAERKAFTREYQRRRRLLVMTKKALFGKPGKQELRPQKPSHAATDAGGVDYRSLSEAQVVAAVARLQPASASRLAQELGVTPQGMGRRLANLKAQGKAGRSVDGTWSLVEEKKQKRSLAG